MTGHSARAQPVPASAALKSDRCYSAVMAQLARKPLPFAVPLLTILLAVTWPLGGAARIRTSTPTSRTDGPLHVPGLSLAVVKNGNIVYEQSTAWPTSS